MMKDNALEELFLANKPVFEDTDSFMDDLSQKLDSVEYIKEYDNKRLRYYRYGIIGALVIGILFGVAVMVFVLLQPLNIPFFTFNLQIGILQFLEDNSRLIMTIVLSSLISLGIVCIINTTLDSTSVRHQNVLLRSLHHCDHRKRSR